MNIHYFSGEAWEEAYVREKLTGHTITFHEEALSAYPDLTDPSAEALCVFIDSPIGKAELDRFPALKLVATRSTGFDHIDVAAAKERGITVVNVPAYGENTVAEFTFALLLALSRHIIEANARVRTTGTFSPSGLRGFDLAGKTLGVLGTGRIGARVVKAAKGFDMNVIAFDAFPNTELATKLGFSYLPLLEVLSQADILTLHVPYNKETHHLINAGNIEHVKKGTYLINTSRGAVIETDTLLQALKDGTFAGAGLDVLEDEAGLEDGSLVAREDHEIMTLPNVLVTPHMAFNTTEGVQRILNTTVENIENFATGTPTNVTK